MANELDIDEEERLIIEDMGEQEKIIDSTETQHDDGDALIHDTSSQSVINHSLISAEDYGIDDNHTDIEENYSKSFLDLEKEVDALTGFNDIDDLNTSDTDNDEAWAKKLLDDADNEEDRTKAETTQEYPDLLDEAPEANDEFAAAIDEIFSDEQASDDQTIPEDEFVLGEALTAGERIGSHNHQHLLNNIEPEPVEIAAQDNSNRWGQRCWLIAIIIALLALAGQYIKYNFDRLARDSSWRPLLISSCERLGCRVPAMHAINKIQASNLVVRSHPTVQDALVVDAIIANRATFKQPFPIMELRFTDISDHIVASRRFQPNEYLGGEMTGINAMPIKQPVHISLDIVDPGEQAVNYKLQFYPASNN